MSYNVRVYFSSRINDAYYCVNGATFSEEFNETLDSAVIILDNVEEFYKLYIKPYEFVKVVCMNENDEILFEKFFLIDNYIEKETNIKEHIYQYTINLMSTTKLLEKIQLPNLAISHSLVSGKKTIYQYIKQYMELYCPKIKYTKDGSNWDYESLITLGKDLEQKFNVECSDLSLSQPTLRQLLTSLMIQIGCIPVLKNRELSFLDFREEKEKFNKRGNQGTLNYVEKSLSSDSYVNTLVNNFEQVLDDENEVISETVGFRNKEKVLIQQLDNLTIETKFPIYEINKFVLNSLVSENLRYIPKNTYDILDIAGGTVDTLYPMILRNPTLPLPNSKLYIWSDNAVTIDLFYFVRNRKSSNENIPQHKCNLKNVHVTVVKKIVDGINTYYKKVGEITLLKDGIKTGYLPIAETSQTTSKMTTIYKDGSFGSTTDIGQTTYIGNYYELVSDIETEERLSVNDDVQIWIENELIDLDDNNKVITQFLPFTKQDGVYVLTTSNFYYDVLTNIKIDITKLVVEASKRQLLNTDYNSMPSSGSLEDLAKFIYGTLSYSIGSKQITGFSQTYSKSIGWWKNDYSYFENILQYLKNNNLLNNKDVDYDALQNYMGGIPFKYNVKTNYKFNFYNPSQSILGENFSLFNFDVYYKPLNTYSLRYTKNNEDIDYAIEQLDNSNNGVIDFERTSNTEQDKINRLGNEIVSINQVANDFSQIQSLNSLYEEDYTIFKRVISIEKDYINVNYFASKNYVMQNYFTSITTKYRAYENIDYNQAIIRKENENIFVLIDTFKIENGDRKIKFKNGSLTDFIRGCRDDILNENKIHYSYEKDSVNAFKNDVSIISTQNILAFIYENYDNVSAGSYLRQNYVDEGLGGIPQEWGLYQNDYYQSHEVGYLTTIPFYDEILKFIKSPLITDLNYQKYIMFNLVDDNRNDDLKKTYYKDNAEIINQTIQFTYYNVNDNVKWTKLFLNNNNLFANNSIKPNAIVKIDSLAVDKEKNKIGEIIGENEEERLETLKIAIEIVDDKIIVNWYIIGSDFCKIVHVNDDGTMNDIIAFKRSPNAQSDTFYVSLNDTKSIKVYSEKESGVNSHLIYESFVI